MFKFTNMKYWCLYSNSWFLLTGPLTAFYLMAVLHNESPNPPKDVTLSILAAGGGMIQAFLFPFLSLLTSILATLMLLLSTEKLWKKITFTLLLSPYWIVVFRLISMMFFSR